MFIGSEQFKVFLQRLKDFKELILIIVFFASGTAWTINYFTARAEFEKYKCINDLTVSMLVNTKSAEFLTPVVRTARRDLRDITELLRNTPNTPDNQATYRSIADQVDEQKLNMDKLTKSKDDAEKVREDSLKKLQAIQLGTSKPCK